MTEPSRGRIRKKYGVDRSRGPLILCAELLQKRLIQHCWPCDYTVHEVEGVPSSVQFVAGRWRSIGPDFDRALRIAIRILGSETGSRIGYAQRVVFLEGPHYIGADGYPKYGTPKKALPYGTDY